MKKIYSASLETMVCKGFTRLRHYENNKTGHAHYTWDETDLVYYHDDIDGDYYDVDPETDLIPNNGKQYENYRGKYTVEYILD